MAHRKAVLLPLLLSLSSLAPPSLSLPAPRPGLAFAFYSRSCPSVEKIAFTRVAAAVAADVTIAAPMIRLLFHDCFVRGCDASILLTGMPLQQAELAAVPNQSVRGQAVIDDVKQHVEAACPGVVSCADVIALAAQAAIKILGGPFIPLRMGRRDGVKSLSADASVIPSSHANISSLQRTFQAVGLNLQDLVTLAGAHTVGRGMCTRLKARFDAADTALRPPYRALLEKQCGGANFNPNTLVNMDPITPHKFDNQYYKNLLEKEGLFTSDAAMLANPRALGLVQLYAQNQAAFFTQFGVSLRRMSEIQVLTGKAGQIRKNCRVVNK